VEPDVKRMAARSVVSRGIDSKREIRPTALVGITLAQVMSRFLRPSFRSVNLRFSAETGNPLTRRAIAGGRISRFESIPRETTDLAAILFTSGSTGPPKGLL